MLHKGFKPGSNLLIAVLKKFYRLHSQSTRSICSTITATTTNFESNNPLQRVFLKVQPFEALTLNGKTTNR